MIMKTYFLKAGSALATAAAVVILAGCDWTTGGAGYSSGRTANINFSGTYNGALNNGIAIERSSGAPINRLVISQQGDALEVLDNNGARYRGRIGNIAVVVSVGDEVVTEFEDSAFDVGAFPEGTQLAQAQVSWTGNNSAGQKVEFVGTIFAVAVTDIQGQMSSSSSGSSQSQTEFVTETITQTAEDGTNIVITTTNVGFDFSSGTPVENYREVQIVTQTPTGIVIEQETIVEDRREQQESDGVVREYILGAQNTQYRLQGVWVEVGGVSANVDALAAGSAGSVSIAP